MPRHALPRNGSDAHLSYFPSRQIHSFHRQTLGLRADIMTSVGNAIKSFLIYLIRCYRQLRPDRAPCCRFSPSCSEYAIQAISIHGAAKGSLLALWRILRCNPFSKGGYDPVPEKGKWSVKTPEITEKTAYERNPR